MTINQVLISNTFNEFRSTVNDVTNTVNSFTDGTGALVVDSANVTGNTIYLNNSEIVRDSGNVSLTSGGNYIYLDENSIANSGVTAGTYGSASQIPVIVIDQKGRITSAANTNVAGVENFTYFSANATLRIETADGNSFETDISVGTDFTSLNASQLTSGTVSGDRGVTAGSATSSFVEYNGTTKTAGQFDGGSTDPDNTTRLNYDGYFYATKFYGDGSGLENAGSNVTNDTSTNSNAYYPVFTTITSGTMTTANVATTKLYFNPSSGTLNSTEFNSLSDETLKNNITIVKNAVDTVNALNGVEFEWKETGQKSSGLIAQNVETVLAHLVNENDGIKSINYSGVIAYLVEAIKELDKRVKELEDK